MKWHLLALFLVFQSAVVNVSIRMMNRIKMKVMSRMKTKNKQKMKSRSHLKMKSMMKSQSKMSITPSREDLI